MDMGRVQNMPIARGVDDSEQDGMMRGPNDALCLYRSPNNTLYIFELLTIG